MQREILTLERKMCAENRREGSDLVEGGQDESKMPKKVHLELYSQLLGSGWESRRGPGCQ